ncbi:hypothetical protein BS636_10215 [Acinetobacter sp. LoGeW2-3]|uniref:hypothetical protein n=1 Tax=Acinetobacter sp. LoGeW2-3 TaxID=1808001 RepID=UPI000C05B4C1|nr:hypothetical protein [Acinetobacter sp. LoGeW2-3]ATO20001.1 hypothetical protein BS636_10215 [Acinetobacter sp. LoGeW2-3]
MIKFSEQEQAFFDTDLLYAELPTDLVEVSEEQHSLLLEKINQGCHVFKNLNVSEPPPSPFHEWQSNKWIDLRTPEEIASYNRSLLPKLSKRQFALYLYDHDMYDQVMQAIEANPRFKIEYDSVSDIERLSPTVAEITLLLGWTEEQVDQMWEQALAL